MFRIKELILESVDANEYVYEFDYGINYFQGLNSTGKTVLYNFLDYMFGSSTEIKREPWFRNSLDSAVMTFEYKDRVYCVKRTLENDLNYFKYYDDEWNDPITQNELKDKLNSVFSSGSDAEIEIKAFTNEDLTYRTFTLSSFLGERRLGYIKDFFDKAANIKYSIRMNSILNYIFNGNHEEIARLKRISLFLRSL